MTDDSFSSFEAEAFGQLQRSFTDIQLITETATHRLYRAKRFGRWYLLKTLRPEHQGSAAHQQMLLKEMEVLMRLQHPGIVGCLGMERVKLPSSSEEGLEEGAVCIVMEYIDGISLKEWLAQKTNLVPVQAERIVSELLSALSYLHAEGITHRDLKPSNVMLTRNGNFVKIIDFSLADTDMHAILKQPSGTAQYMSPEQATQGTPDIRNDIYSLGIIMKELLKASPSGGGLEGSFWHKITDRCLQSSSRRYANIEELQADIDRYKRRAARRRWRIPLAVLVLVLLAGAVSIYKLDADRRAMYLQMNRIPIATESGLECLEEQISATGLTRHTDTLTAWRYLDPQINEKILAVNAFCYDYVEGQLPGFTADERKEILIVLLDRWQAWHDTITTRAKDIIAKDTMKSGCRPSCPPQTP